MEVRRAIVARWQKGLSRREMTAAGAAGIASSAMLWGVVPSASAKPGQGGAPSSPGEHKTKSQGAELALS